MDKTQIFIEKSNKIHSNKYTYAKIAYYTNRKDVIITCNKHGDFLQKPHNHLSGKGCPKCSGNKKLNKDYFLTKSSLLHKNKYSYEFVNFIDSNTPVKIFCPIHGLFEQLPKKHINGSGCYKCGGSQKLTNEEFIQRSNVVHKNKYDYSLTNYISNKSKVIIICKEHGEFTQYAGNHIKGVGCMECSGKKKLTNDQFIERSNLIHENKYDYSLTEYINHKSKVFIICPIHGKFDQRPNAHLRGAGCLSCPNSKMEDYVDNFLKKNNFRYKRQHMFNDLKDKGLLKFDFAIFDNSNKLKFLLEYNGEQHYKYRGQFGMEEQTFIDLKRRDIIKEEYCKQNKIDLIIIKYNDKIDEKLSQLLII
jgi:hypothetical protein